VTHRDPIASLAPVDIYVSFESQEYLIPAMPALDWLRVLMRESPSLLDIVPGLLQSTDRAALEDLISTEAVPFGEVEAVAYEAISIASGRDYWVTIRLVAIARASWDTVGGLIARSNIRADQISLGAWVDAVFHICCELIASGKDGKQHLVRFTSELEAPPPGVEVQIDEEFEALAFERAVRMSQP
jgi:hypothetical protein